MFTIGYIVPVRGENLKIISGLLLCANILLAVVVAKNYNLSVLFVRLKDWLMKKIKEPIKHAGGIQAREGYGEGGTSYYGGMKLLERIELLYIEKSNIRHYLPFMNVYILILMIILIFVAVYRPVYSLLRFFPSSAVISAILSIAPLFVLELISRYNAETIRRRLAEYISVLSRWCAVKEDIVYAFEKSLSSNIGEPLQTFIRDMVIQVNRGMDPWEALDILQMKVDDLQFRDFIVNVKLSIRHRGDIIKLLSNLENQFYKIDEEYNRRKISTYKDRLLIYFIMFAVLGIGYFFIKLSPQVSGFYLDTITGKLLLMVFSGMYAFGFYLTAGITRFRNQG